MQLERSNRISSVAIISGFVPALVVCLMWSLSFYQLFFLGFLIILICTASYRIIVIEDNALAVLLRGMPLIGLTAAALSQLYDCPVWAGIGLGVSGFVLHFVFLMAFPPDSDEESPTEITGKLR